MTRGEPRGPARARPPVPPPPAGWRRSLAPLARRDFLRLLAGSGALAAGGASGCAPAPDHLLPEPAQALAIFDPREYATFQAVAARMVGPVGAELIAAGRVDPAAAADAWLARSPGLAGSLQQALWAIEWGVAPLLAKWRPFTSLAPAAQDRVLDDLMGSRLDLKRDLFKGLKSLSMLTFYADPESRPLAGYPGPFDAAGIRLAMSDGVDG